MSSKMKFPLIDEIVSFEKLNFKTIKVSNLLRVFLKFQKSVRCSRIFDILKIVVTLMRRSFGSRGRWDGNCSGKCWHTCCVHLTKLFWFEKLQKRTGICWWIRNMVLQVVQYSGLNRSCIHDKGKTMVVVKLDPDLKMTGQGAFSMILSKQLYVSFYL